MDQGVRPTLQRQVPRRQVLPIPCPNYLRNISTRCSGPRTSTKGNPVLRSLRPCMGHSRDPRRVDESVRSTNVSRWRLQAGRAVGAAMPAWLYRQVLRTMRGSHRRRAVSARRGRHESLPRWANGLVHQGHARVDGAGVRAPGLRGGWSVAGSHGRADPGDGAQCCRPR